MAKPARTIIPPIIPKRKNQFSKMFSESPFSPPKKTIVTLSKIKPSTAKIEASPGGKPSS